MISYGAKQYKTIGTQSGIENASPHRLIQMLIDGALERISIARGQMQRNEIATKGATIGSAISIIGGLQASLDKTKGGDIANNLDALYDYISNQLMLANKTNDVRLLDESTKLMTQIKTGWDGIETEAKTIETLKAG
jgi:flagellar protein FliS